MAWLDLLLTREGTDLLQRLTEDPPGPADELAVQAGLRKHHANELVTVVMAQVALRVRARRKFSNADVMLFTSSGLEQASSERMACNHARRFEGVERMADLCSGVGSDLSALARDRRVIAADIDPVHARLSSFNARANHVTDSVSVVCADVRDLNLRGITGVFIDPARRSASHRFGHGTTEPALEWCLSVAERVPAVAIKSSPVLPVELVPAGWEIEFVSERRELKESLLLSPALHSGSKRRATILPAGSSLGQTGGVAVEVGPPGRYLLDPDPAVTRAGLVEDLAVTLGACWKIDEHVAFLSTDERVETPFARTLEVIASMPFHLKTLRKELRALDIGRVDVRTRGFAADVDEIRKKLKLTGERSATVVLTRVSDAPWMLICT